MVPTRASGGATGTKSGAPVPAISSVGAAGLSPAPYGRDITLAGNSTCGNPATGRRGICTSGSTGFPCPTSSAAQLPTVRCLRTSFTWRSYSPTGPDGRWSYVCRGDADGKSGWDRRTIRCDRTPAPNSRHEGGAEAGAEPGRRLLSAGVLRRGVRRPEDPRGAGCGAATGGTGRVHVL